MLQVQDNNQKSSSSSSSCSSNWSSNSSSWHSSSRSRGSDSTSNGSSSNSSCTTATAAGQGHSPAQKRVPGAVVPTPIPAPQRKRPQKEEHSRRFTFKKFIPGSPDKNTAHPLAPSSQSSGAANPNKRAAKGRAALAPPSTVRVPSSSEDEIIDCAKMQGRWPQELGDTGEITGGKKARNSRTSRVCEVCRRSTGKVIHPRRIIPQRASVSSEKIPREFKGPGKTKGLRNERPTQSGFARPNQSDRKALCETRYFAARCEERHFLHIGKCKAAPAEGCVAGKASDSSR